MSQFENEDSFVGVIIKFSNHQIFKLSLAVSGSKIKKNESKG
jgi:hypothetical protein